MSARVAVFGCALRTPLGDEPAAILQRLLDGDRAAAANPLFDAQSHPCALAAGLAPRTPRLARARKFLRRMGLHAVEVGIAAMADARTRWPQLATLPGERLGLFFGYGGLRAPWDELMPAMQAQDAALGASFEQGLRLLHPFFMLQQLSNNAHALCAEELAARGEGVTLSGANAGAQALACAQAALAAGTVDAALCVAYDSLIAPEVLVEQGLSGALTSARSVGELVAPYAASASGAVPGEAAAALLLLREEPRNEPPLFYLRAADAAGISTAETLVRAAKSVLAHRVAVVDGAAQAVAKLDFAERTALAAAGFLREDAMLTATLSGLGQIGAAAPLAQAMVMAAALRSGRLPKVAGLSATDVAHGPLPPLIENTDTTARSALCLSASSCGLIGAACVEMEGVS